MPTTAPHPNTPSSGTSSSTGTSTALARPRPAPAAAPATAAHPRNRATNVAVRAGQLAVTTGVMTAVAVVGLAGPAAASAPTPGPAKAPTPGQIQPPGTEGLLTMLGWGGWLVSFVCVAGLLVVAAMMALKHRRGEGGGEALGSLGWVLGACVLGSAAGPLANALV